MHNNDDSLLFNEENINNSNFHNITPQKYRTCDTPEINISKTGNNRFSIINILHLMIM